jgi:hypothetical protein
MVVRTRPIVTRTLPVLFCYNIYPVLMVCLLTDPGQLSRYGGRLEYETDDGHIGEGLQSGTDRQTLRCRRLLPWRTEPYLQSPHYFIKQ